MGRSHVSHADLRQTDAAAPVHITYDYVREDFGDWKSNRIYSNLPALEVTVVDREKAPDHDIDLGAPRTLEAHSVITLPAGDRAELPEAVHIKRDYATYDKTYRLADGKLTVDRLVVVKQHKIAKSQWKDYLAFQKAVGMDDGEPYIALILPAFPNKPTPSSHPNTAIETMPQESADFTAAQLVQQAAVDEGKNDWETARKDLTRAMQIEPKAPYLMSTLAGVEFHDHKPDEALADLQAELREHPEDRSDIVFLLAESYANQKRFDDAIALLKSYSSRNDKLLQTALVQMQRLKGDDAAAFTTMQNLVSDYPDDRDVQYRAADLFYKTHHFAEAAAVAKKAMDGSDDPGLINDIVYILSEMKVDLPFAESSSRHSIEVLEKRTAEYSIEAVNSRAFTDSSYLTASWDTLAYILLLQGKVKDAEPYFQASWFNRQDVAVGNHLAQTYEALGRKGDALRMNRLALAAEGAAASKDDYAEVKANIERLEKIGAATSSNLPTTLQQMRSYHVPKPAGVEGGGTVRLQLDEHGVVAVMLVSGAETLHPVLEGVRKLKLTQASPPGSQARILRDAVLYCGKLSTTCDFVFMHNSGIAAEGAEQKE